MKLSVKKLCLPAAIAAAALVLAAQESQLCTPETEMRRYPGMPLLGQRLRLQVGGPGFNPWSGN